MDLIWTARLPKIGWHFLFFTKTNLVRYADSVELKEVKKKLSEYKTAFFDHLKIAICAKQWYPILYHHQF